MPVIAIVSKDNIRLDIRPDLLKPILDRSPFAREIALAERPDLNLFPCEPSQKVHRAVARFFDTRLGRAEHNPADIQIRNLCGQLEQCPARADLDVVRVCAKTKDAMH